MSEPFIGEIKILGFTFPPRGYSLCAGQTMSISQNTALYSLLGTYYGGDGQATFKLPDLRSRVPVGQGQGAGLSNYPIGAATGTEATTLLQSNMPAHTHTATTQVQANVTGITATTVVNAIAGPSTRVIAPGGNFITSPVVPLTPPVGAQAFAATGTGTVTALNAGTATTTIAGGSINAPGNTIIGSTGQNMPFSNLQPLLAINYSIALQGIYPSRN